MLCSAKEHVSVTIGVVEDKSKIRGGPFEDVDDTVSNLTRVVEVGGDETDRLEVSLIDAGGEDVRDGTVMFCTSSSDSIELI